MSRGDNQPHERCSQDDFIRLFESMGARKLADHLGLQERAIYTRRVNIERRIGRQLVAPENANNPSTRVGIAHPNAHKLTIENGTVLIASDCHYWPGKATAAHRAFVKFCADFQPKAVIMNGDVMDGATISRHPSIGWENKPSVVQEIEVCQERLAEIERAAPNAKKIWTLGNHCARFETRLATVAPEFAKTHGFHLKDFFSYWQPCWSVLINSDVVVKHRFKGGIHATHNATMWAGMTMITGHLHSLKVTPFTDYRGTRFGVDTGCLADVYADAFQDYTEQSPVNWRSGFVLLTFHNGRLLWPELVPVHDEESVEFRGKVVRV